MALWKVFPGKGGVYEADFLEHSHVGVSFGCRINLQNVPSKAALQAEHQNGYDQLWRFLTELQPGSLVAVPFTRSRVQLGEIAGDYQFRPDQQPYHVRPIRWLAADIPDSAFDDDLVDSFRSPSTVHQVQATEGEERVRDVVWRCIDEYLERAQPFFESGQMESEELRYKQEMIEGLGRARAALLKDDSDWVKLIRSALNVPGSPMTWRSRQAIYSWFDSDPARARSAMREFWADDSVPAADRIRQLIDCVPESHGFKRSEIGMSLRTVSALLMALGPDYPPFTRNSFAHAFRQTRYPLPGNSFDAGQLYDHALGLLDLLVERGYDNGFDWPNDYLEAQSIVWTLHQQADSAVKNADDESESNEVQDLDAIAHELLLPPNFLQTVERLLEDKNKRQLVFQGPPGTGKTYVARRLAEHLAGSAERVRLVQFHPSYAYEDFVQGYRPTLDGEGRASFELRDGPLLEIANLANIDPDNAYFLVIDEINRGNLAKVFGELYFLLEYRDEPIGLQYSNQPFSLPDNLRIIGTMNTADRSIALVDLALRRRFYFVEFHPDSEPITGLLSRWLDRHAPDMEWVADVVEAANRKLDNRDAAIGPSYFMREALDEEQLELVWQHNVLPYIEEQLYGEPDRLSEFALEALRAAVSSSDPAERQGDASGERDARD